MGDPKPTFDFTKVSRRWSQAMAASIQRATKAQIVLTRPPPKTEDDKAIQAHFDAQEKALDVYAELADEQAGLIAQVLVDVPREWLIPGAPEELNWGDAASFDYIQEQKYSQILALIQSGEARTLAKN
jgi:hypothetical protein